MLIKVRFPLGWKDEWGMREYTYTCDADDVSVGDLVEVNAQGELKHVLVSAVDVDMETVPEFIRPLLKPINGKVSASV